MTARPNNFSIRRWAGLCIVLCFFTTGVWLGCSTPHERYKTLAIFFDGVPNPDAVKPVATTGPDLNSQVVYASSVILSRHKPYVDATGNRAKCGVCHRSDSGNIMEFDEAYKTCLKCHTKIAKEYPRMHGPVAVAAIPGSQPTCKWCHTAHESREPALLKDTAVKVCTQCHDAQLLSPKPAQHLDGTSCIQCHFGHGGDLHNAQFLKPGAIPQWPTSQPATRPATQPTTQPGTAPAPTARSAPPAEGMRS